MQMYKGLPIITNKIPESERNGIPHHLLDFIDLRDKPWSVQQFVKRSSHAIDEIRARGRLPIVVGGTIYYTFSLLFSEAILDSKDGEATDSQGGQTNELEEQFPILSAPTEEIFTKLKEVDPEMAKRWHPKDRLKIRNSLRIYLQSGRKASEIYADQRRPLQEDGEVGNGDLASVNGMAAEGTSALRSPSLLLWLEAEDAVLKQRLNDRVDSMVADGLCDEVVQMAGLEQELKDEGQPIDMTYGIWGSIGYKEMKPWLEEHHTGDIQSAQARSTQKEGIEAVKASTRRYAKRQNRFVRLRLGKALKAAGRLDLLFLLDCTDLTRWRSAVGEPAEALVTAFLAGDELPKARTLSTLAETMYSQIEEDSAVVDREARTCDVCQTIAMTEKEWTNHLASRRHKKLVARRQRQDSALGKESEVSETVQLPHPPD
jgi:tRNA dimethylallyltransferase